MIGINSIGMCKVPDGSTGEEERKVKWQVKPQKKKERRRERQCRGGSARRRRGVRRGILFEFQRTGHARLFFKNEDSTI
jgi:hypothetical protein